MTKERKQILLTPITELVRALYTEDIPTIIRLLDEVRIDSRYFSDITNYVKELLIDDIKTHLECCTRNRTLRVDRKNVYNSDTFDVYTIKDGVLCRAGRRTGLNDRIRNTSMCGNMRVTILCWCGTVSLC